MKKDEIEAWLNGPIAGVPALLQPVAPCPVAEGSAELSREFP